MEQPLTAEQIDEFSRLGFLVIEKPQIPEAELQWCRDILMRMILGGERRSEGRNLDLTGDGRCRRHDFAELVATFDVRNANCASFPIEKPRLPRRANCWVPPRSLPAITRYSSRAIVDIRLPGTKTKHFESRALTITS